MLELSTKRAFDLFCSASGLILLSWLILPLILTVRLTSPGPGLFAQVRIGRYEKPFTCYKLRTMYAGTPVAGTHEIAVSSVTSIGLFLRSFKLDELPQLWNVLKGDMSFVGPRPCLPSQYELIEQRRRRGVFSIRPGITGRAQILGIDMSQPDKLAEIDAQYVADQSFVSDTLLILKTIFGAGRGDPIRRN
jgi:O-antigen biosynthesis protein WbqP